MRLKSRGPGAAPLAPALILAMALLALSAPQARALGPTKPWFGGLYAATCGFSEQTGLPAAEYLAAGLFAEPFAAPVLNPAVAAGVLLPLAPCDADGIRFQLTGEITILDLPAPGLGRIFYNSLCWSPGIGAEVLVRPDFSAASFALLASPLRFRAGDGVFTLVSLHLFVDPGPTYGGWGITLFQATLFLL